MTDLERYDASSLDLDTIRQQFAPHASRLELEYFAAVCRHLGLDPWAGHIYLIGRRQKVRDDHGRDTWQLVHKPQIAVAGRRAIASRPAAWSASTGPSGAGPAASTRPAPSCRSTGPTCGTMTPTTLPLRGKVLRLAGRLAHPRNGTVKWSEFAVYDDADRTTLGRFWKRSPSHMLGKVAESLALRRAFPEVEAAVAYVERPGDHETDDAALIAEAEAETAALPSARPQPPCPHQLDRVPDHVYDDLPEARGVGVDHSPRYDPTDATPRR